MAKSSAAPRIITIGLCVCEFTNPGTANNPPPSTTSLSSYTDPRPDKGEGEVSADCEADDEEGSEPCVAPAPAPFIVGLVAVGPPAVGSPVVGPPVVGSVAVGAFAAGVFILGPIVDWPVAEMMEVGVMATIRSSWT
jgi:hypothetical protein